MSAAPALDVSVIVCTRDRLGWLQECVASVLDQAGPAFELLIVDDLSSDDTRAWLSQLEDARVRILLPDVHLGRAAAANRAIALARGRHLMLLDDDDLLRPRALQVLTDALDHHPEAVAAVGARWVWFTAENYQRRDAHPHRTLVRDIFRELLFGWSAVSGQNLYRTAVIQQLGGYRGGFSPCDDRDLWLRVAARGAVVLRPETVVTYRLHPHQWRPANLRQIREAVALRAIRALPRGLRRPGLRLRRSNRWLDEAEDCFAAGRFLAGALRTLRAVAISPRIYASPLIGAWVCRRLAGRIARRFVPPRQA